MFNETPAIACLYLHKFSINVICNSRRDCRTCFLIFLNTYRAGLRDIRTLISA